jgi:hypothetical protein
MRLLSMLCILWLISDISEEQLWKRQHLPPISLCWFTRLCINHRQQKSSVITAVDCTNFVPSIDLFVFNVKNVLWKKCLVFPCAFEHKRKFQLFWAWQLDNGERCYTLSRGDRRPMGSLQDTSYTISFKLIPYILQELWPHEQFTLSSSVLRYLFTSSQMWLNILCHVLRSPQKNKVISSVSKAY